MQCFWTCSGLATSLLADAILVLSTDSILNLKLMVLLTDGLVLLIGSTDRSAVLAARLSRQLMVLSTDGIVQLIGRSSWLRGHLRWISTVTDSSSIN